MTATRQNLAALYEACRQSTGKPTNAVVPMMALPAVLAMLFAVTSGLVSCSGQDDGGPNDAEKGAGVGSEQPETAEKTWPPGAVLAVGGLPILESEVDRIAEWVMFLQPENTQPSLRRQALTHIVLDRAAFAGRYPERRNETKLAASTTREELLAGADGPDLVRTITGTWSDLGLGVWGETRSLKKGIWSSPVELVGRWVLIRRDATFPGIVPAADQFTVSLIEFPYAPTDIASPDSAPAAIESQPPKLTVIDPEWEALVPSAWGKTLPEHWYAGPK